ncbi:MAG: PcfJ domain-containing protein [Chromatiaceae bacterium]|nr:PcfJ domain-containing protein [Chromatiaceae bacterium]
MFQAGRPFEHWAYRLIGDASLNTASMTLLSRLLARGELRTPRAWLLREGLPPALRQALRIQLPLACALPGASRPLHGLWLVEQTNGALFCHAIERTTASACIGGRVEPELAVLDPEAPWIETLSAHLAAHLLPSPGAARVVADQPSDRQILARVERALLRAALGAFLAGVDGEALVQVRAEGCATPARFNHYAAGSQSQCRNRIQAARAYPALADVLREDWRLRRAIDQGEALAPLLGARLGLKPRLLARTRSLPIRLPKAQRLALLRQLAELPADYLPDTTEDWTCAQRLAEPLLDLAQLLRVEPASLLKPLRAGWRSGLEALERESGAPFNPHAILEMMQATYEYGLRPALLAARVAGESLSNPVPRQAPRAFYPLWFGRYGLARLAGMAARWRRESARLSLQHLGLEETDKPLRWTALLPGIHSHGPWCIQELTSQQALDQEGLRLSHCVGGYALESLLGESFIFGVRDRLGQSSSTFELTPGEQGWQLVQHRAHANSEPTPEEQALVGRFLQQVVAKVSPARLAAVIEERQALLNTMPGLAERLANYSDQRLFIGPDTELADQLATLVEPFHPAEARRAGLAAHARKTAALWQAP